MPRALLRSASWAPTIALSWLWGLGFFYAIHVTLTYGWLGFAGFALPNAFGLFLFGWLLGAPRRDPAAILKRLEGSYAGLFLLCQIGAVAITVFAFVAYLWTPMIGGGAAFGVALLILVSCALGHGLPLRRLKVLHAATLVLGLGAGFVALYGLQKTAEPAPVPLAAFDARFYGLVVPTLVGFLLGPWIDIQQWQRAVEIRAGGGSVRAAYAAGALLFLGLLTLNACLAASAGIAGGRLPADGVPAEHGAVALAVVRENLWAAKLAFLLWTAIAASSTIDSFYCAARWFTSAVAARSQSPLLAFIPAAVVSSPLWLLFAAVAIALSATTADRSLIDLMLPFATVFVGGAACLVCEALGADRAYDATLCYLIGLAAALLFLAGYVAPEPILLTIAPLVALVGALPMIAGLIRPRRAAPAQDAAPAPVALKPQSLLTAANEDSAPSYGFDGQWFVFHMTPTYDDTNSVGNIYFANYVRWVGKARELFFNVCMPDFDLATTEYYVLTRAFDHEFRREAREFESIRVRIRIAEHNRKFVTLAHEIHSDKQGLLGRGKQSLMFVDTVHHRPLDIPRAIVEGFLPYWPKTSPHAEQAARPPDCVPAAAPAVAPVVAPLQPLAS